MSKKKNATPRKQGKQPTITQRVWWSVLKERTTLAEAADSIEKVAMFCGWKGYGKLSLPYMRTDAARNKLAQRFMQETKSPTDVLVMLDNDHTFPPDIVGRLVDQITDEAGGIGVIGALAFRRGEPFEPCFFKRVDDGSLRPMAQWEEGVHEGTVIGHACVAIARWVFDKLIREGYPQPFWRYQYQDGSWDSPSEDMWFGKICEAAGIHHYCDTRLECPHLILGNVDRSTWQMYMNANPEVLGVPPGTPANQAQIPVLLGMGGGNV